MGRDLEFLQEVAPDKLSEAMQAIFEKISLLLEFPQIGNPVLNPKLANLRKLIIDYGKYGYVTLYTYDESSDIIVMQTIRHGRELEPIL